MLLIGPLHVCVLKLVVYAFVFAHFKARGGVTIVDLSVVAKQKMFKDGSSEIHLPHDRIRGRPRAIWGVEVGAHASMIGGPFLEQIMLDEQLWKKRVRSYIRD